ncbi:unnamed protein product [Didymodactylos carnosus]|uniref:Integrase zinc-binding domain-containing protein n=1 Tax=Didymodactylos carnosus TaxID=1234261 RepID=A0A815DS71_9BILA|nr:unnamed protein product [Didymodactylos carnosus]CAF4127504.1 unnamed protein product [Didymodactylos carnosus]
MTSTAALPSSSSMTTNPHESQEKLFYNELGKYIDSLSENFKKKCVIKKEIYDNITKVLTLEKGKSSVSLSSQFVYWACQNFVLSKIAGNDIVCCAKAKKPVCIFESFYNVIGECHNNISHGGRHKTVYEINSHYSWLPRFAVDIFVKQCLPCQLHKPVKHHVVSKPIISLGVMTRLQINLVDMRTRPDKVSENVVYNWILNCIDHYSKFC